LFGWRNKNKYSHNFWATFINLNSFGRNLKNKIRGQFANFKIFEGSNYSFWKIWGVNLQFFINLLGSNWKFWKIWGPNCKIWKII